MLIHTAAVLCRTHFRPQRGTSFLGWFDSSDCVYEAPSVTFPMGLDGTLTATWKVDSAMEPFDFTSDEASCRITAIRDTDVTEIFIPAYAAIYLRETFVSYDWTRA